MNYPQTKRQIGIEVLLMVLLVLCMTLAAVDPASAQGTTLPATPADLSGAMTLAAPCLLVVMGIIRSRRKR
jgi:hypothetical protein